MNGHESQELIIGLVEDSAGLRRSLTKHIEDDERVIRVHAWSSAEECLADAALETVHAALLDIGLPGMSGVDLCLQLAEKRDGLPILMLTTFSDAETIFNAVKAGAMGYLLKSEIDEIVPALITALDGGSPMTPTIALQVVKHFRGRTEPEDMDETGTLSLREQDVLRMLADGAGNRRIAADMHISENTVKFHVKNIYRKLHVTNRAALMEAAIRRGLV